MNLKMTIPIWNLTLSRLFFQHVLKRKVIVLNTLKNNKQENSKKKSKKKKIKEKDLSGKQISQCFILLKHFIWCVSHTIAETIKS